MSENENHIDKVLDDIISVHQMKERVRKGMFDSSYIRSMHDCEPGDRVSMTLLPITLNGNPIETEREIEGTLVRPSLALVKIHMADGIEEWEGRTIGFATHMPSCFKDKVCAYMVAARQEVAYFYEEDLKIGPVGNLYIPDEEDKIHTTLLTYGRVAVSGSVYFDHTPRKYQGRGKK